MEINNLKDLKNFLGTLTDEQLLQSPIILVDDTHYHISLGSFTEYDVVWNEDMDEGSIPIDEYDEEHYGYALEDSRNTIYPKGSIVQIYAD